MRRRDFITLIGGAAAWPLAARAQQAQKIYRIGWLSPGSGTPTSTDYRDRLIGAFTEGLRQLGWIEGQNFIFERRYAEWLDRMPELAKELVNLEVDVIVTAGTLAPLAVKRVTATIPIVTTSAGDPLGSGLVASLARPGGNVTGLSLMVPDLGGKRLEMLKEFAPSISRVAVIWNAANPYSARVFGETKEAAQRLGLEVQSIDVRVPADFDYALEAATEQRANALVTVEEPLTTTYRKAIVDFAAKNRLPAIYGLREFADDGGLIAYGANLADLHWRAAGYVDKIFKGAKPADLPVQQPTKFELVINLKTAKAVGLEIPPTLLARADEVIE
jgi:putative tryptophan/tyrosine transport system substrate-binding protein